MLEFMRKGREDIRAVTKHLKCDARPHELIRQHNWAFFTFLVVLEQLGWPSSETQANRYKFYRFEHQTLQLQEALTSLLDDFGVT